MTNVHDEDLAAATGLPARTIQMLSLLGAVNSPKKMGHGCRRTHTPGDVARAAVAAAAIQLRFSVKDAAQIAMAVIPGSDFVTTEADQILHVTGEGWMLLEDAGTPDASARVIGRVGAGSGVATAPDLETLDRAVLSSIDATLVVQRAFAKLAGHAAPVALEPPPADTARRSRQVVLVGRQDGDASAGAVSGDMLHGAAAIARFTGLSQREIYSAAERGELPVIKVAGKLRASKAALVKVLRGG